MPSDRLHVAHFSNTYEPNINGVARAVASFRKALTSLGHNVFVFAPGAGDYVDLDPFIFRYPAVTIPMYDYPLALPVSSFVEKLLPHLGLHVVHSHHPFLLGEIAARKAVDLEIPLVFTLHSRYADYSHQLSVASSLVETMIERTLAKYIARCQRIIVPSTSIKNLLSELVSPGAVSVVPTGIDIAMFQRESREGERLRQEWGSRRVILSVGRLVPEKKWENVLWAAAAVMGRLDNVLLVIVGDGPQRGKLESLAASMGIDANVQFVGAVEHVDMPAYLQAADVFCFASTGETQGLVTIEALAAGLPVVAVDAPGTRDIIHDGVDGLLTPDDDEALAAAVEKTLTNATLRQLLHVGGLQKASTFDIMTSATRLAEVYIQAVEERKRGLFIEVDWGRLADKVQENALLKLLLYGN